MSDFKKVSLYEDVPTVATNTSGEAMSDSKSEKKRYCLKRDDDTHWYLVPFDEETAFDTVCGEAYRNDDFEVFEARFGDMRIDGPHNLSFTDPRDSEGNKL